MRIENFDYTGISGKILTIAEFGHIRYFARKMAHFLIPLFGPTTVSNFALRKKKKHLQPNCLWWRSIFLCCFLVWIALFYYSTLDRVRHDEQISDKNHAKPCTKRGCSYSGKNDKTPDNMPIDKLGSIPLCEVPQKKVEWLKKFSYSGRKFSSLTNANLEK